MVRIHNLIFAGSNCLRLAVGLAMVTFSICLTDPASTECQKALKIPIFLTGLVLSVLAVMGLICSCCEVDKLIVVFAVFVFLWTISVVFFAFMFTMLTDVKHDGQQFHLDRANLFQKKFFREKNWRMFKKCFIQQNICSTTRDPDVDFDEDYVQVFIYTPILKQENCFTLLKGNKNMH